MFLSKEIFRRYNFFDTTYIPKNKKIHQTMSKNFSSGQNFHRKTHTIIKFFTTKSQISTKYIKTRIKPSEHKHKNFNFQKENPKPRTNPVLRNQNKNRRNHGDARETLLLSVGACLWRRNVACERLPIENIYIYISPRGRFEFFGRQTPLGLRCNWGNRSRCVYKLIGD